jgi:hypothetical protein
MSSVCVRQPRLVASAALALAIIAATGVAMPRSRSTARDRVGRAVSARFGSTRVDDRLTWVAPDPSAGGVSALTTSDAPLVRPTDPRGVSLPSGPAIAGAALGPAVQLARAANARTLVCAPVDPPAGRAPPVA